MIHIQNEPFRANYMTDVPEYFDYHTHFDYEIYYFHEGQVNYLINDRIHKLMPGDLILMHGMTLHKALLEKKEVYKRTIIHFNPLYFEKHFQPSYTNNLLTPFTQYKNLHLSLSPDARLECEALLAKTVSFYDRREYPYAQQRANVALLELMLFIGEQCSKPLDHDRLMINSTKEKHVQDIISYIEQHYADELTLDQVQNNIHLNKFYLSKTFKEVTGTTIFQYLLERRIYAAKLLLIEGNHKITDICLATGFKHLSHFSRSFKHITGLSPEQYRRQHQYQ